VQVSNQLIIHDVKGLEKGEGTYEEYKKTTLEYLENNTKSIHVIWYVLGLGGLRILDGDFDLIHVSH
jgi:hypothetical protein